MKIVLTGFMGTGKSVVGRRLAERLGLCFIDVDDMIEEASGTTIAEIFASEGESGFRRWERELIAGLAHRENCVIATGGGAVLDSENVRNLKSRGVLLCLQAAPRVILERIGASAHRPLLEGPDRFARIVDLLNQRAGAYGQADFTVETSESDVEQIVDRIIHRLCLAPAPARDKTR